MLVLAAGIAALVAAAGASAALVWPSGGPCQESFVPAFFSPAGWDRVLASKPLPETMILDLTASGAGRAPEPAFQRVAGRARMAGVQVLGYVDTGYGRRPVAQIAAEARHYRAWYQVSGIFLDQVASRAADLGYYRGAVRAIRQADPGAVVWLNPGSYPSQGYMSIADVVMVYEGPYARYLRTHIPGWASRYPSARFAHTVYGTPATDMASAVRLARQRNAGYVYVTSLAGPNPYAGLPRYWSREYAAVARNCGH
jgi:hypothetical protein